MTCSIAQSVILAFLDCKQKKISLGLEELADEVRLELSGDLLIALRRRNEGEMGLSATSDSGLMTVCSSQ